VLTALPGVAALIGWIAVDADAVAVAVAVFRHGGATLNTSNDFDGFTR
jgi:hypothetical protein